MSISELAKSTIQGVEEVMSESVSDYLEAAKSANSEILRRLINVVIHRLSIVVKNLVIALEVPNIENTDKLDILRIRVEELEISDSLRNLGQSQALENSVSDAFSRSEKKTAKIRSFSIELFQIDKSEKSEILHLDDTRSPILSIPNLTEFNFELNTQPFNFTAAVNLEHVNVGMESSQVPILASITQQLSETLSKTTPPPLNPQFDSTPAQQNDPKKVQQPADEEDDDDDEYADAEDGEDEVNDDAYDSDGSDSSDDNSNAILVLPKTATNPPGRGAPGSRPNASHRTPYYPNNVNIRNSEPIILMQSQNDTTVFGQRENLAVDVSICVSYLQVTLIPSSPIDPMTSSLEFKNGTNKSQLDPNSVPSSSSSTHASSSSLGSSLAAERGIFTLESLHEPPKTGKNFVHLRFVDLGMKSSHDASGNSRFRAHLSAFAIREHYRTDATEMANIPDNCVLGEKDSTYANYLSYPFLRIHSHAKSAPQGSSRALQLKHSIERKIPTTSLDIEQISLVVPGKLPKLLSQVIKDFSEGFSISKIPDINEEAKNGESEENSKDQNSGTQGDATDPSAQASSSSSTGAQNTSVDANPEKRRWAGLGDSSSSSEPDPQLASSTASVPNSEANNVKQAIPSATGDEEEAPPPSKKSVKIGHVFVSIRVPVSISNRYSFPVYRKDFLAAHIRRPTITLYSSTESAPSGPSGQNNTMERRQPIALPNDTIEFETFSAYLLHGVKDVSILARPPNAAPSKRYSGSDAHIPKWFLRITASATDEPQTEAVSIRKRPTSSAPPDVSVDSENGINGNENGKKSASSNLGPNSASRGGDVAESKVSTSTIQIHPDYKGYDSIPLSSSSSSAYHQESQGFDPERSNRGYGRFEESSSFNSSRYSSSTPPPMPKFAKRSFDNAPFSSIYGVFEGEKQPPKAMDARTWEEFRGNVMTNSDLAVTVTVHMLELDMEKKQCDLIQDLVDGILAQDTSNEESQRDEKGGQDPKSSGESQSASQGSKEYQKMMKADKWAQEYILAGTLFSGFALELRVSFASMSLTTSDRVEYRFSNVESLRLLFVSQYLHTSKSFMVLQVGTLRLPSADSLPNTHPIFSKIPDYYDELDDVKVLTLIISMESLAGYWKKRSLLEEGGTRNKSVFDLEDKVASEKGKLAKSDYASSMIIFVQPTRLAIEYRLGERWISDLGGFFVRPDVPVDMTRPVQKIRFYVNAHSSALALRGNLPPSNGPSNAAGVAEPVILLHLNSLVVSSTFAIPALPQLPMTHRSRFRIRGNSAQLFIIDDKGRIWLKPSEAAAIRSFRQYWIARGYSPCGEIESASFVLNTNELQFPKLAINLSLNRATLDVSGDQLFALTQLVSSLSNPAPESLAAPPHSSSSSSSSSQLRTSPHKSEGKAKENISSASSSSSESPSSPKASNLELHSEKSRKHSSSTQEQAKEDHFNSDPPSSVPSNIHEFIPSYHDPLQPLPIEGSFVPFDKPNSGLVEGDDDEEEEIIFKQSQDTLMRPQTSQLHSNNPSQGLRGASDLAQQGNQPTSLTVSEDLTNSTYADAGDEYVLVQLTPEMMKQREMQLERNEWLNAFKMGSGPLPNAPTATFMSIDGSTPTRMPKLIEEYRPKKIAEEPAVFAFVFAFKATQLTIRLREGVSLLDDDDQSHAPTSSGANNGTSSSASIPSARREHRDALSSNPAPNVQILLQDLNLSHTNDDEGQSETNLSIRSFEFRSARDATQAGRTFIQFDRSAPAASTRMLTFKLSTTFNSEAAPALHPYAPTQSSINRHKNIRNSSSIRKDSDTFASKAYSSEEISEEELSSVLVFTLLPVAVRVDIEALEFLRSFYATFSAAKPALAAQNFSGNSPYSPSAYGGGSPSTSANTSSGGSSHSRTRSQSGSGSSAQTQKKNFSSNSSKSAHASNSKTQKTSNGPHFRRVSISPISLNLTVAAWALGMDEAIIRLPSLYCRGVDGWSGIVAELNAAYQPLLYSSLFAFAGSLPVVRLVLSILGSVSNLVIEPYAEYQRGRSAAAGAFGALTVGATSVASEVLRFGAWVTSTAGDGLQYLESFWHKPDPSKTSVPANIQQGAQLGYSNMVRQVASTRDCLVVMPLAEYRNHKSALRLVAGVASAVPLAVLKPVIGVTHGLSSVMRGASNAIHVPGRFKENTRSSTANASSSSASSSSSSSYKP